MQFYKLNPIWYTPHIPDRVFHMQSNYFKSSKELILNLGYDKELFKVNLISGNGRYTVDYEPCNFLRNVIESGVINNLVSICNAFNTFATGENHPFGEFVKSNQLYGNNLTQSQPEEIIKNYESWFELNKNNFADWC